MDNCGEMVALGVATLMGLQVTPSGAVGHHAVRVGKEIFVVGGMNGHDQIRTTWAFDPVKSTWLARAEWQNSRSFGVAAKHDGKMYVFGGIASDGNHSNQIDAYDPVTNKWSAIGMMPETMTRAAGVVWHGKMYLSGGYNGVTDNKSAGNSARLWEYDLANRKWKSLKAMTFPRHGHCMVPFQGRLWAVGGFLNTPGSLTSVESYDPVRNTWRNEHALPKARGFFAAAVVGGKLIAFGQLFEPAHPIEWTSAGWKDRASPDLPIRRFAYVQDGVSFLIFGGEEKGVPFQMYKP